MVVKSILVLFGLFCVNLAAVNYTDFKVYNVIPSSEKHIDVLLELRGKGYDFWSNSIAVNERASIMVSPQNEATFLDIMKNVGLSPEVPINNVQKLIDLQMIPANINSNARNTLGSMSWDRYHDLSEIHVWLDDLPEMFPGVVETVVIGTSLEGREIKGVIIDFKAGDRDEKPLTGMIEGGIHAREWISPATVTWIIKEFLTSDDADVRSLAETFVWHIFPVVNPDGYEYTLINRLWRKNRNPNYTKECTNVADDISNGIDLNRNFAFLWMTEGASAEPCDETFAGGFPASELETQAIARYVQKLKESSNVIYYFAFHSFSQMILVPYSHTGGADVLEASNYGDMYEIAARGAAKLSERYGTQYTVGTSKDILYVVTGSSFDWVKGTQDIPIVYLFELRDTGLHGFLLPPDQIIPNNEEIVDCLIEMDKTTRSLRYYHSGTVAVYSTFLTVVLGIGFLRIM